jgi:ABC-type polar amino acid transport system ATPase subunit
MTMIVVTHQMQFAREVGMRVLFMDGGRVVLDAPPGGFFASQHTQAREFLRRVRASSAT